MSKQLYEEVLADVKRVKEVAEDNARRAILEAVTPRIRELIERELLQEADDDDDDLDESWPEGPGTRPLGTEQSAQPVDATPVGAVVVEPALAGDPAAAISTPDAEGKVTLDIDALCGEQPGEPVAEPQFGEPVPVAEPEEYEVSLESVDALSKLSAATKPNGKLASQLTMVTEAVRLLRVAKPSKKRSVQIAETISRVEDMYDHVQASIVDPALQASYGEKLEALFKNLNELQEPTMSKKNETVQLDEADVTLKLTGLPDDVDLDSVGVDLITGEEEEGGAEGAPEAGAEGGDLGGLDMGGEGSEGTEQQMETLSLSDDTIVEIDEGMLRREIARMKSLREETEPASWGTAPGAKEEDDFGGAKEEGDPLDVSIRDVPKISQPLGEADDDDLDEQDQLDEQDDDQLDEMDDDLDELVRRPREIQIPTVVKPEGQHSQDDMDEAGYGMDELQSRAKLDTYGPPVADGHESATWDKRKHESLQRRASFETKLQARAKARAASLKKEAKSVTSKKQLAELKKTYATVAKRFNESLSRSKKISKLMAESVKLQKEATKNGGITRQAGSKAEEQLRTKLAETNLFNAKLVYTNKLLQNESLTVKQKSQIIKRLDEAKTLREVKLVYESLTQTLVGSQRTIRESADRKVLGSASTATRPASTSQLNEGAEAARWAQLAGITAKR